MRWGLVPSSHTKSLKEFNLSTHNCCSETILERPIYSKAFFKGQRCVIPADGFYEWNSTKGAEKIPHFVHREKEKAEEGGEKNVRLRNDCIARVDFTFKSNYFTKPTYEITYSSDGSYFVATSSKCL